MTFSLPPDSFDINGIKYYRATARLVIHWMNDDHTFVNLSDLPLEQVLNRARELNRNGGGLCPPRVRVGDNEIRFSGNGPFSSDWWAHSSSDVHEFEERLQAWKLHILESPDLMNLFPRPERENPNDD